MRILGKDWKTEYMKRLQQARKQRYQAGPVQVPGGNLMNAQMPQVEFEAPRQSRHQSYLEQYAGRQKEQELERATAAEARGDAMSSYQRALLAGRTETPAPGAEREAPSRALDNPVIRQQHEAFKRRLEAGAKPGTQSVGGHGLTQAQRRAAYEASVQGGPHGQPPPLLYYAGGGQGGKPYNPYAHLAGGALAPGGGSGGGAAAGTTGGGYAGGLAGELQGQMQSTMEAARAANEARYQQILDLIRDVGEQGKLDISERGRKRLAQLQQQMISSGLSGTSAPWGPSAMVDRETAAEQRRLAEQMALMKAGFIEGRTDAYPDIPYLTGLLERYGQVAGLGGLSTNLDVFGGEREKGGAASRSGQIAQNIWQRTTGQAMPGAAPARQRQVAGGGSPVNTFLSYLAGLLSGTGGAQEPKEREEEGEAPVAAQRPVSARSLGLPNSWEPWVKKVRNGQLSRNEAIAQLMNWFYRTYGTAGTGESYQRAAAMIDRIRGT